ncbi:MAG: BRO family protein, partial [Methylococcales bacterium]|nr:BRO family protein [Methylococcales bacterium]
QQVRVLDEPNLYRLIFGSTLESAKRFQDWVFEEVLPSIRKTGKYEVPNKEINHLSPEMLSALRQALTFNTRHVCYFL